MAVLDELRKACYPARVRFAASNATLDRLQGRPVARVLHAEVSKNTIQELLDRVKQKQVVSSDYLAKLEASGGQEFAKDIRASFGVEDRATESSPPHSASASS